MPKMPWASCRYRQDGDLHVLTSRLPLKRYRDLPRFLMWTLRIQKQLNRDPHCAGYTLDAHLLDKTFLTLSAWKDQHSMMRFVHRGPHARMLADMKGRLGEPTFVESTTTQADLPLDWAEAVERLDHAPPTRTPMPPVTPTPQPPRPTPPVTPTPAEPPKPRAE